MLVTHDPVLAGYANRRIVLRDGMVLSDEMNRSRGVRDMPQYGSVVGRLMASLSYGSAAKIAAREMRSSRGKFFFVVLSVAIGVAALTGVRGFSASFRGTLLTRARIDYGGRSFGADVSAADAGAGEGAGGDRGERAWG